jgi:23S rRNA pseudouridine2605 synthase
MQLNKFLALCGAASRRKANDLIARRRVTVNGKSVERLGVTVDPETDFIQLDGKTLRAPRRFRYVLLNKPAEALSTVRDVRGRKTVLDLVESPKGLFPVGRLDLDTDGVLLLTNDGGLAFRLTHPKFEIDKVYEAWVAGAVGPEHIQKLRAGVTIEPGATVSGDTRVIVRKPDKTLVEVRVHEGKKRQVKLMFRALGFYVIRLTRTRFAGLTTRGLKLGESRALRPEEVRKLYRMTGIPESGVGVRESGSEMRGNG